MLAPLTATTDPTGLPVECLLAPARGMAGDAVGVGVVGVMATMVVGAGATDGLATATDAVAMAMVVGSLAGADLHAVRLAASVDQWAVGFMVALWPAVVEGSTVAAASTVVAEDSTVAVVDTAAAGTGNPGGY
ncbi:MAG: hypothetical protein WBQ85_05240 [Candidatus Sulfotelmatobacter sp.]